MTPAILAGLSVWFAITPSPRGRVRSLWVAVRTPSRPRPDPGLVAAALTPVAAVLLVGWPMGLVIGLLAAPVVRAGAGRLESAASRRRDLAARRQMPAALDLVAAGLQAGRPPGAALALAAHVTAEPLGSDLATLAHRIAVVSDLRVGVSDVSSAVLPLARALRRADQSGVPIADVVSAVALDVRREHHASRRELARQIGVRTAVPLGICFMPAFLLIGIVPTIIAVASNLRL